MKVSPFFSMVSVVLALVFSLFSDEPTKDSPEVAVEDSVNSLVNSDSTKDLPKVAVKDSSNFPDINISIGSSFDFLNKANKSNIYGDFSFFWHDMWMGQDEKSFFHNRLLGLEVGVYNGRIVSIDSSKQSEVSKEGFYYIQDNDSFLIANKNFSRNTLNTTDIFSIYLTLNAQVVKKVESVFLISHYEVRKKKMIFSSEYSLSSIDTLAIVSGNEAGNVFPNYLKNPFNSESAYSEKKRKEFWSSFLGAGFLFYNENNAGKFKLKLIIGREFEYHEGDEWKTVGMGQFSYVSDPYKIKFGVEIKGHMEKKSKYSPEMLFYLSKTFEIDKLLKFVLN